MNLQDSNPNHHDPVERALVALEHRNSAAPGLNPAVIEQTLARLAAAERVKPNQTKFNWKSIIMKPTVQLSAAAVLAMVLLPLFWLVNPGRGGMALAVALAKVADVRSVSYRIEMHGRDQADYIETTVSTDPPRMRTVIEPQGLVSITDFSAGKSVMLNTHDKSAQVIEFGAIPQIPGAGENLLEMFKIFDSKDFDQIGQRTIGEHKAVGFRQKKSALPQMGQRTIWVDQQTQLPVEVEMTMYTGAGPDSSVTMTDIQWGVPVSDEMFSLSPPSGYRLQAVPSDASSATMSVYDAAGNLQTVQEDTSPITEKDLIDSLDKLAQLNDGRFPDTFDMRAMKTAAMAYTKKLHAEADAKGAATANGAQLAKPDTSGEYHAMSDQFSKIARGLMFAGSALNGSDWHYAGKGAVKGEAATPIFWYVPHGATMYRIIDANLNVGDVPADQLPKVPSVVWGSPLKK